MVQIYINNLIELELLSEIISKFIYLYLNLMHCVRKFTIVLSAIFLTFIAYSGQSVIADHLEAGAGIYKDISDVNLVTTTQDSKWQVSLLTILRTSDGQLINVTESTANAAYIPHQITDHVFDTLMGEKEIVTIDDIKYEKVQYTYTPTLEHRFMGFYPIFSENFMWSLYLLQKLVNICSEDKDFSMWKIHYCATFEGHGFHAYQFFKI